MSTRIRWEWIWAAVVLGLAGCQPPVEGPKPPPPPSQPIQPAPLEVIDRISPEMLGELREAGALGASLTLVDFWAPWDPGSSSQIEALRGLVDAGAPGEVAVAGMALPDPAGGGALPEPGYPVLEATHERQVAFGGVRAIPTRVLIDADGRVLARYSGFVDPARIGEDIAGRLGAPAP